MVKHKTLFYVKRVGNGRLWCRRKLFYKLLDDNTKDYNHEDNETAGSIGEYQDREQ